MEDSFTKSLIIRVIDGDEEAFKLIYEKYWSRLYSICYYYSRSREDTEDMLMNIFTSLWRNKANINIECFQSYLVKAAKNQSFKYIQKKQRRRISMQKFSENIQTSTADFDIPDKMLEMKEFSFQLNRRIQSLPGKTRKIFLLNRNNGLTYEQIASSLNISEKTVEYHISKALRLLAGHTFILLTMMLLK